MDLSPQDVDYLTRTVIGEAGNQSPQGQAAVASVILNRLNSGQYGKSVGDVVFAPHQFEAWSAQAPQLMSLAPDNPQYQKVAQVVNSVVSGKTADPTGGATYFLNPDIVKARTGGQLPSWASGQQLKIGDHVFYYGGGKAPRQQMAQESPDYLSMFLAGQNSPVAAPSAAPPNAVATTPAVPAAPTMPIEPTEPPDYLAHFSQVAQDQEAPSVQPKPFTWRDTWPVKLAQGVASALTLPGDVYAGRATVPQSDVLMVRTYRVLAV